ncbi:MAG: hypothetical protein INR69_12635 [Mucilaginibacter polytrichastri]|nr:hypothetical protein [Mucilaginibacter polytrichastri]
MLADSQFTFEAGAKTIWHLDTGFGFRVADLTKDPAYQPPKGRLTRYGRCGNQYWAFEALSDDTTPDVAASAARWYGRYCELGAVEVLEGDALPWKNS